MPSAIIVSAFALAALLVYRPGARYVEIRFAPPGEQEVVLVTDRLGLPLA